jgi:hypothetical protein
VRPVIQADDVPQWPFVAEVPIVQVIALVGASPDRDGVAA